MACNAVSLFTHDVIGGTLAFAAYAIIWWFIWWIQFGDHGISHFYAKLVSAALPMVILAGVYIRLHPTPNYTMMIPLLPSDIHFDFSTVVTGTLLFPVYSVVLQRFLLPYERTWLKSVSASVGVAAFGTVIFIYSYAVLPTNW